MSFWLSKLLPQLLYPLGLGLLLQSLALLQRRRRWAPGLSATALLLITLPSLPMVSEALLRPLEQQASALALPFSDGGTGGEAGFDAAYVMHVGMNIADKPRMMAEAARVLRPGGKLVVYDVMTQREGPVTYPLPWSDVPENSAVDHLSAYEAALHAAGLVIEASETKRDFAVGFFEAMVARMNEAQAAQSAGKGREGAGGEGAGGGAAGRAPAGGAGGRAGVAARAREDHAAAAEESVLHVDVAVAYSAVVETS